MMLADRKTKSCRALIAFRFLKLNLFMFKFGKLIMDRLHEVLFSDVGAGGNNDGSPSTGCSIASARLAAA
jgi:hypothetical protein